MRGATLILTFVFASPLSADEPSARRGYEALTKRSFNPAPWAPSAYDNAWKRWTPPLKEKPANYDEAFRHYYGLHPAPFDNGKYPLGLREGLRLIAPGIASDCMLCHGGSILGRSYIGLGNSTLDIQALFQDLNHGSGLGDKLPFTFSNVRGTSEAGAFAVFLHAFRNPDLSIRSKRQEFDLRDDLCEDVPAWWLLKKKQTMYHTGTTHARSVRSIMQFMLTPLNHRAVFEKEEATFRDIQAYLLALEPPVYPFAIDREQAKKGEALFRDNCAKCHGTYGEKWTYPNKVIPIKTIGTDATRLNGFDRRLGEFYNASWFAQEKGDGYKTTEALGYQAPPLDGVWATAPYFHNGSVPTLEGVLNSKARPKVFTRSFRTDADAFDRVHVGWKFKEVKADDLAEEMPAIERRKIYDTTQPGRGNGGHTFGDQLTSDERRALIEYLKTL
jgi:mono/diheme cytochrome c family protein